MIPSVAESSWQIVINNPESIPFQALPTRMLMMRVKMLIRDKTPQGQQEAIKILHDFFSKNEKILQDDFNLLLERLKNYQRKQLMTLEEASFLINQGKRLLVAGERSLISKLPRGQWIGGSSPYFMSDSGGVKDSQRVLVTMLPDCFCEVDIRMYSADEIKNLPLGYKSNGVNFIIIPAFTEIHQVFAQNCSSWHGIFDRPLVGWVSGMDLDTDREDLPIVINGKDGTISETSSVVMHANLTETKFAKVNTINLFSQGRGSIISFSGTSFEAEDCFVNGKKMNLAQYIKDNSINTQLPLVASYMGENINVSIRSIDKHKVSFYAPVFENIVYRFASPIGGTYEEIFIERVKDMTSEPIFTCNCILNYLYANLEGKKTANFTGAVTFGEIAYMLLNQTAVYLTIEDKKLEANK